MLKAPPNKIVVKVPHKYIRSISGLLKRASIENASTVDPSDFVNIFGDVVAVPAKCFDRPGLEGYSGAGILIMDNENQDFVWISPKVGEMLKPYSNLLHTYYQPDHTKLS